MQIKVLSDHYKTLKPDTFVDATIIDASIPRLLDLIDYNPEVAIIPVCVTNKILGISCAYKSFLSDLNVNLRTVDQVKKIYPPYERNGHFMILIVVESTSN